MSVSQSMTGSEMSTYLPGAKILTFKDIANVRSLSELLPATIILYELQPSVGHWCLLFQRDDGTIEFFDSLGFEPDAQRDFIDPVFRQASNQQKTYIIRLLLGLDKRIEYNEKPLQVNKPGINSCGRWCMFRLAHSDKTIKQFQDYCRKNKIDDKTVTQIVPNLISE